MHRVVPKQNWCIAAVGYVLECPYTNKARRLWHVNILEWITGGRVLSKVRVRRNQA